MGSRFGNDFVEQLKMGVTKLESKLPSQDSNGFCMVVGGKLIKITIDLGRIDGLELEKIPDLGDVELQTKQSSLKDVAPKPAEGRKFSRLSDLTLMFITYMIVKLSILLYLQNEFDITCHKLQTIAMGCLGLRDRVACFSSQIVQTSTINCSHFEGQFQTAHDLEIEWENLHQKHMEVKEYLKMIGNPFMYIAFASECIFIFMIVINIIGYFGAMLLLWRYRGLSFAAMRALFLKQTEMEEVFRMIGRVVNSYANSSDTFLQMIKAPPGTAKLFGPGNQLAINTLEGATGRRLATLRGRLHEKMFDHEMSMRDLVQMASEGELHPINLRPKIVRCNTQVYLKFLLVSLLGIDCYAAFIVTLIVGANYIHENFKIDFERAQDYLFFVEFCLLATLNTMFASLYVLFLTMTCIDQISYADKIVQMVVDSQRKVTLFRTYVLHAGELVKIQAYSRSTTSRKSINGLNATSAENLDGSKFSEEYQPSIHQGSLRRNESELKRVQVESELMRDEMRLSARSSLLATLIQYKLFAEQFKHVRAMISVVSFCAFLVIISVPIAVQVYSGYFHPLVRNISAGCAIGLTILINGSFLPLCELHHRCKRLTQKMAYLLAYSVEAFCTKTEVVRLGDQSNSFTAATSTVRDYDTETREGLVGMYLEDHIIWSLRRELNHPEKLYSQFTVTFARVNITFGTIIKVYFWLGVLLVPSMISSSHEGASSDRLMRFLL